MALLIPIRGKRPTVHPSAFLAPTAVLVGNVRVEAEASIWFGAVLRGDDPENGIVVGAGSSVQENCVVHVGSWGPTLIGRGVTVGHGAKFESCEIGDHTLVGMNAVILQEARIGKECVIAANAVVMEGAEIPDRSVVAGVPGTVRKTLEGSAADWIHRSAGHYVELSREYLDAGVGLVRDALQVGGEAPRCDRCGHPLLERHCKLVCLNCGFQRDCSDP